MMKEPSESVDAPQLKRDREALWRRVASVPLIPLSWAWLAGARLHRACYSLDLMRAQRLPCKVIAIGSPLAGGTGKTPLAAFVAAALADRGHRVVVASRGYGRRRSFGRADSVRVVSDGRRLWGTAERCGDEPMWLASRARGVPVLVAADRYQAGLMGCSVFGAEVVVLDDGLQHHRLHHDLAIATLDGGRGLGNRRGLPGGPLRQAASTLRSCDALVAIGDLERDADYVQRLTQGVRRVRAQREIVGVRGVGQRAPLPVESLGGLEVGLLAGVANPQSLRDSIERSGGKIVAERLFRDHHRYRERDLRGLRDEARIWLTSEKDAVKLRADWLRDVDLRVVASELRIEAAAEFVGWLEARAGLKPTAPGR